LRTLRPAYRFFRTAQPGVVMAVRPSRRETSGKTDAPPGRRLAQHKVCLPVMIGVRTDRVKQFIALDDGPRESPDSRADLLCVCKRRGVRGLGF